jgi:hypothetical protein
MSIPPAGDAFSMALFLVLLAGIVGLVAFVWIKLGARPKTFEYRGLKLRLNLGLPAGKIVLTNAAWQPIGQSTPDQFDTAVLPPGCAAALFSAKDFAAFTANGNRTRPALAEGRLQA